MAQPGSVLSEEEVSAAVSKLEGYIWSLALRYSSVPGYDPEDAAQEGRIAAWRASFFYNGQAPFVSYAKACAKNGILTVIRMLGRKKRLLLRATEDADLAPAGYPDPEEEVMGREFIRFVRNATEKSLTPPERAAFALAVSGYGSTEIAKLLNVNEKSADNALQRARRKLQKYCRKEWF